MNISTSMSRRPLFPSFLIRPHTYISTDLEQSRVRDSSLFCSSNTIRSGGKNVAQKQQYGPGVII